MKITAPLDKWEEVKPLIQAGANELYCGILDEGWLKKFSNIGSINRREWSSCNFRNFDDLKKAVGIAHSYHVPVFLTINSSFYMNEQYPLIMKLVKKAQDIGIDALIVTDLGLLLHLKRIKNDAPIFMSTGATVFNSNTVQFYKKLGASRVVLPRHLTIREITKLCRNNRDMEFETFIFNDGCFNIDGFCTADHGIGDDYEGAVLMCRLPYKVKVTFENKNYTNKGSAAIIKERVCNITKNLVMECGACAVYNFHRDGVVAIKIIGRGKPTEKKIKDTAFFRRLADYMKEDMPKKEFLAKAKSLFQSEYKIPCSFGQCYYPL